MKTASKIAAKDSCNFALNKGNSNETNIKVTPEIAALFGKVPNSGESFDVSFYIEKGDFLRCLCQIMGALPLYNNKGQLVTFSEQLFQNKTKAIDNFFGNENAKEIKAKLAKPGSHPICLNFGANNFCIRDFLVESRSLLTFTESNGKVRLNVKYEDNSSAPIEENTSDGQRIILQQIFYGAPGTGKSHGINTATKGKKVIRTTFHPDSDYSTFVGAYKPTTLEVPVTTVIGTKAALVEGIDGNPMMERKIVYEYVSQAFLQAYVEAWKLYCNPSANGVSPMYLVIEEINRGNCAQIFGDLFQLLDRNDNGYSCYPIQADQDIQKYLVKEFEKLTFPTSIAKEFEGYNGVISEDIKSGKVLVFPNNLYIWATMNTSDQSLFPIDSAFKRRWEWQYIPIDTEKEKWAISTSKGDYAWSSFLDKINEQINDATSSEDKKLGFYFCKATNGVITAERLVSKVLFYVYNDVFKDYGFDREMFKGEDGKSMSFQSYYNNDGSIDETKVVRFLKNLKVKSFTEDLPAEENNNPEQQQTETSE